MPRILLVEDNEMSRDMLSRRLGRHGFEITLAVDGAQGIALARSSAPDLVLVDMDLPIVDGWEVARVLKGDPDTRAIPIIAITAHAMQGEREKALAAGCDEFETKPLEFSRLLEKIRAQIARAQGSR